MLLVNHYPSFFFLAKGTLIYSYTTCNLSGKEQETPHAEDDVQINADRGSAQKRSVADGVQINGGTSSKRKRIKCQDIALPSSYDTKPLSPNHQDVIGTHVVTAENFSGKSQPSGRYLRSSGSGEFMPLKSETKNDTMSCKMSGASDVQKNRNSIPELRNRSTLFKVALCKSSSAKASSPLFGCGISSKIVVEEMDLQNDQSQLQNILDVATTPLPTSCNIALDNMELCMQEVCVQQVFQLFRSEIVKNINLKDYFGLPKCKLRELDDFSFI